MGIVFLLLMVVDQINVASVPGAEAEDHPPVGPNRYRPETSQVAFQRMQSKARQIHIGNDFSCIKPRKNVTKFLYVL